MNAKPVKHEHKFEKELEYFCSISGVAYIKIPDWIATRERIETLKRTGRSNEKQKPFDGVMITPKAVFCIECKYGKNTLSPHQKEYKGIADSINRNSFLVLRKLDNTLYQIESCAGVFKFNDVHTMVKYIKEIAI